MSSLGIVSVHYQPRHVPRTLQALRSIGGTDARCVAVANLATSHARLLECTASESGRIEVMRHDNAGMEFGAYQAGLERLLSRCDPEWVLFVNDTIQNTVNFAPPYRRSLRRWVDSELAYPAIVGYGDELARSYQLGGIRTHRWIRTHLFALNRPALAALERRIHRPDLDMLVNLATSVDDFFSAALDPVLRDHLEVWLFRTRPGPHWYQPASLEGDQAARTAAKARSILQEKFLAARLEGTSARFCDVRDLPPWPNLLRKLDDIAFRLRRSPR